MTLVTVQTSIFHLKLIFIGRKVGSRTDFLLSVCFMLFRSSGSYSAAKTPHPVLTPLATNNQAKQVSS